MLGSQAGVRFLRNFQISLCGEYFTSMVHIAVIVISWNTRQSLERCLASLVAQEDPADEVIVVDNGSSDDSVEMARRIAPGATVIELGENRGFAEGCNLGIESTSTCPDQWITLLNSDAYVQPNWISKIRQAATDCSKQVGSLQTRVLQVSHPQLIDTAGIQWSAEGPFEDRGRGSQAKSTPQSPLFCASACAAAYRRSMLDSISLPSGVFEPALFAYFEDVDLGWRARLAGFETLELKEATSLHERHASSPGDPGREHIRHLCRRNRVSVIARNASARLTLQLAPRLLKDLVGLTKTHGYRGAADWYKAGALGLRTRRYVSRTLQIRRRDLEKKVSKNTARNESF
ncbi:MAG: hypothetical protein CL917_08450 [Deltaproteobacteria bacterium]|nr:hypothetical protein [Deltaproteobacteria bacterium]